MRAFVLLATVAVGVASLVAAPGFVRAAPASPSAAEGAPNVPPPSGQAAPPPAPGYPPPGTYPPPGGYPPPPGSYPPPGPYPQYGAYPPNAYGYDPQRLSLYNNEKKALPIVMLLEVVVPGLGSVYAEHLTGAVITWALTAAGVVMFFLWFDQVSDRANDSSAGPPSSNLLVLGYGLMLTGRIYGLVDSYTSAREYNRALAMRLGLPAGFALGVAPIKVGERLAWGPSLSLRF